MSLNLLETAQNYFGGDAVRQASAALGESESGVGTALRSAVPLVLGGLLARAQQPGGPAELLSQAQEAHSSGVLGNLGSLLGGVGAAGPAAGSGLLGQGEALLRNALGAGYEPTVAGVGQQAGVAPSTMSSLLGMATPVVLGLLGKHAAENNLDAGSFGSFLGDQRGLVAGALGSLPGGLGNLLGGLGAGAAGLSGLGSSLGGSLAGAAQDLGGAVAAGTGRVEDAARGAEAATPTRWPWLLLLLALAATFYFVRGCNKQPQAAAPVATAPAPADTAKAPAVAAASGRFDEASGNYIYDTGAGTEIKLPNGTVLKAGANSLEAKLVAFLNDAGQTVSDDKSKGWLSLDRVYFTIGKAALTAESQAQLKNLAAILKAFPNAAVKLGGYTDSKGQAPKNLALSAERANSARKAVIADGVDQGRVAAEGYGAEHPLATNDTPAGRAQNRRVDARVTKK